MIDITYRTVKEHGKIVVYETGEGLPRNGNYENRYQFKNLLAARKKIHKFTDNIKAKFGKKAIITWIEDPAL